MGVWIGKGDGKGDGQGEGERERDIDRQVDRETDRETKKQADRQNTCSRTKMGDGRGNDLPIFSLQKKLVIRRKTTTWKSVNLIQFCSCNFELSLCG